jgi:hypothetical protein
MAGRILGTCGPDVLVRVSRRNGVAFHWAGLVLTPTQHMADHQPLRTGQPQRPGALARPAEAITPSPEWVAGRLRRALTRESDSAPPQGNIHTY